MNMMDGIIILQPAVSTSRLNWVLLKKDQWVLCLPRGEEKRRLKTFTSDNSSPDSTNQFTYKRFHFSMPVYMPTSTVVSVQIYTQNTSPSVWLLSSWFNYKIAHVPKTAFLFQAGRRQEDGRMTKSRQSSLSFQRALLESLTGPWSILAQLGIMRLQQGIILPGKKKVRFCWK